MANETLGELAPLLAEERPSGLGEQVALPAGRWTGDRAATDILALAGRHGAFGSLETLLLRQRGEQVFSTAARSPSPPPS